MHKKNCGEITLLDILIAPQTISAEVYSKHNQIYNGNKEAEHKVFS